MSAQQPAPLRLKSGTVVTTYSDPVAHARLIALITGQARAEKASRERAA